MRTEVQLNVRVPAVFRNRVRRDAARFSKTAEIVVTAILKDFFSNWTAAERERFYKDAQPYRRFTKAATKPVRRAA